MQPSSSPDSPLRTIRQTGTLPVEWDPINTRFSISLHGVSFKEYPGAKTQVTFAPPHLYDIRIRQKGSGHPFLGFLSPSSSAVFVGVEPGAEYEVQTQIVDAKTGDPLPDYPPDLQTLRAEG